MRRNADIAPELSMRIGLQVPYLTSDGGPEAFGQSFGELAQRAEAAGFDSLWMMDHFFQIPGVGPAEADMLEGWSALAFAAGKTSRIKLGTMVSGVTYRHPGVLVKTATTLDVLSGGRAYLGIGAAWFDREHAGLGVPFPPMRERFERLEETLQVAHQMWSDDNGPYNGKHYQLAETLCVPQPVSRPHPPILIGGVGERKTLRFVAKYADATNISMALNEDGLEIARHKLDVLRQHCEREGRNYDDIEKTVLLTLWIAREPLPQRGAWMSEDQAIAMFERFRSIGVDQCIVNMARVERPETLEFLSERVLPAVAAM
jgi:F420-dependent oxidoreductase-like protein